MRHKLNFFIFAHKVMGASNLSALLGQRGVPIVEFVKQVNDLTNNFVRGVCIPVKLLFLQHVNTKTVTVVRVQVRSPSVYTLLLSVKEKNMCVKVQWLFEIMLLKTTKEKQFQQMSQKAYLRLLFGVCKSVHFSCTK